MADNLVKFYQGTAAQFATAPKDANTLYFITDERRIYKGDVPFSGGIYEAVTSYPADANAVVNTLYVNTVDGSVKYWNGVAWQVVVKPAVQTIGDGKEGHTTASHDNLVTEKAVYDYIWDAIGDQDLSDITDRLDVLEGADTVTGSVAKALKDAKAYTDDLENGAVKDLQDQAGSATLETTAQTLSEAVNELNTAVTDANAALTISATVLTGTDASEGAAKTYKIYQGAVTAESTPVATIDIPKDMVVSAGTVETVTDAQIGTEGYPATGTAGQYIKLVVNNGDVLWIPANALVDEYTTAQPVAPAEGETAEPLQVQLSIDSNRVISATIGAGKITATELATDAVTTAKIADKNVTKDKLSQEVQNVLDAVDDALTADDIAEGATNGTIAVDGTDVAVHGLDSMAYEKKEDYATKEQGEKADSALQKADIDTGTTNGTILVGKTGDTKEVAVAGLDTAAYAKTTDFDAAGAAATAEANAKAYVESLLTWKSLGATEPSGD